MHLTLKFIGHASGERAQEIRRELGKVSMISAVQLEFRGWGFFPDARRPQVFWAGVHGNAVLGKLAGQIDQRLEALGINREVREFRPHLTLARFKSQEGLPALRSELARFEKEHSQTGSAAFGNATIEEFHLLESTLRPTGAVHTILETFPFVGAQITGGLGAPR
jgi:2'-5' RNA ligase